MTSVSDPHLALPALFLVAAALAVPPSGCKSPQNRASSTSSDRQSGSTESESPQSDDESRGEESTERSHDASRREERLRMVRKQIAARGIDDQEVLAAMEEVPRHLFVPDRYADRAYADTPLPIGHDQTISQPYIVAAMSEALQVDSEHEVLEIGTGSGYQAAILGRLAGTVYSIEIICDLAERARETLNSRGYDNIEVKCGDGYRGWPKHAPFDRIIVTAAPPEIPDALVEQLAPGGRMVVPVGDRAQDLKVVRKNEDGSVETDTLMGVRFVPMVHGDDTGP